MGNLTVKENGEMVNIISPNVSKITSFKVHFSPKQEGEGDPSPDNVREIIGWDGVETNAAQRNIYANTKNIYRKIFIPSGTTWTASCDGGGYVYVYDTNQKYIDSWALSGTDETSGRRYKTVTISSYDIYYVRINGNKCQNPQFEFGALSEYEPVVENSITFSSDIGTIYGGYVDLVSGELVQEYFKYSFTGDEDISISSYVKTPFIFNTITNDLTMPFGNNPNVKPYCNILNTETSKYHYISDNTAVINNISRYSQVLFRGDIFGDTAETAKAKLKELYENGTPLTIVGTIRDTVIDNFKYQLTPQQLSTFKGQNNFWSNADYVEIEYELTETFDIQKAKRKIILNQPHVESASGDIVTFDTDMKGKLKECKVYFSPVQEGEGDPSPDNVRNIVGWNGVSVGLPSEYQEIEWIQGNGGYINTEYIPTINTSVELIYERTASGGTFTLFGINSQNFRAELRYSDRWYGYAMGYINYAAESTNIVYGKGTEPNIIHSLSINENGLTIDGYNTKQGTAPWNVTLPIYIFGGNTSTGEPSQIVNNLKIYSFKLFENGIISYNLIPCYRKSDNEIGMYDTVSKQFFTNQGTGTFLKGADVDRIHGSIDWTNDVGTVYGGYVDLVSGELVEEWYSITFNGENVKVNCDYMNTGDKDYIKAYWVYFNPKGISDYNCKCSTLKITYNHNKTLIPQTPCLFLSGNGETFGGLILGKKEDYPELAEGTAQDRIDAINNWFKENPTQVVYKLKTPIHYQLTPQQLTALRGTNNIYSNTNGQTEIKYWRH